MFGFKYGSLVERNCVAIAVDFRHSSWEYLFCQNFFSEFTELLSIDYWTQGIENKIERASEQYLNTVV